MSQMVYSLTSTNCTEIRRAVVMLKGAAEATGFVHESYPKNDSANFTRAWFAWANTLFGELIATVAIGHPALLRP